MLLSKFYPGPGAKSCVKCRYSKGVPQTPLTLVSGAQKDTFPLAEPTTRLHPDLPTSAGRCPPPTPPSRFHPHPAGLPHQPASAHFTADKHWDFTTLV